ncbi:hypothetical protein NC653_033127 [Populus alba x Populus x berolinensis]|uniref:Uncharacterized protein n=1 Tax=Populus alba x Populus x berolinensis TaxID=444605 RepID=A0AAD6PYX9_9ROSI|nr:hypothetical protein NC653_033127 [Populus alba x Populus x berolinensis]
MSRHKFYLIKAAPMFTTNCQKRTQTN